MKKSQKISKTVEMKNGARYNKRKVQKGVIG